METRGCEVQDSIDRAIDMQVFRNILPYKLEFIVGYKMCDILRSPSQKVVQTDDIVAAGDKRITDM